MLKHTLDIEMKNGWKGTIEMEVPRSSERMSNIAKFGAHKIATKEDLKKAKGDVEFFEKSIPILSALYDGCAAKLIRKVSLTGPSGEKVESQELMETHGELQDVWMVIAFQYIAGFGPGKKTSQS